MDPNEALELLRAWAGTDDEDGDGQMWLERGPEVFRALDEWLTKGGFLPHGWHLPWVVPSATDQETDARLAYSVEQLALRVLADAEHEGWRSVSPALARRLGEEMAAESRRTRELLIRMANSPATRAFISEQTRQLMTEPPKPLKINPDGSIA